MLRIPFMFCCGVFQACLLSLTFDISQSTTGMTCIVRISATKMDRRGNCEQSEWNRIREEIKAQVEEDQRGHAISPQQASTTRTHAELPTFPTTAEPETSEARTIPAIHYGPVSDDCRYGMGGKCFWVELTRINDKVNYTQAVQICVGNGSVPAVIANRTELEKIRRYILPKIGKQTMIVWLGLTVDFETKTIQPEGAYSSWISKDQIKDEKKTNVFAMITSGTLKTRIDYPYKNHAGVVCWKP